MANTQTARTGREDEEDVVGYRIEVRSESGREWQVVQDSSENVFSTREAAAEQILALCRALDCPAEIYA